MNFIIGYHTDTGIRKSVNQDALLIKTAKSPYGRIGLFVICDGLGGLSLGEAASSEAIRNISFWFDKKLPEINFNEVGSEKIYDEISKLIFSINTKIMDFGQDNSKTLGTTLTFFMVVNDKYYIMQVGDSRAYEVTCDNILQLTKDQTFVQREVDRGNLTKEEAENHPRRNVLLQCVGARENVEPVMVTGDIKKDAVYLICSDGFYKKLREEEIEEDFNPLKLNSKEEITNKAVEITERVKKRNERDNISAIIFKAVM